MMLGAGPGDPEEDPARSAEAELRRELVRAWLAGYAHAHLELRELLERPPRSRRWRALARRVLGALAAR
jgi:anti-sigma factor RsiW